MIFGLVLRCNKHVKLSNTLMANVIFFKQDFVPFVSIKMVVIHQLIKSAIITSVSRYFSHSDLPSAIRHGYFIQHKCLSSYFMIYFFSELGD